ncbi:MAG: homoserine O-acetyltransferase [Opitutales bacterium]|nr:homoserine O-acetyltransferase [Opitutales bacterium]
MNDFSTDVLEESRPGEVGIVAYSDFHSSEPLDFALGGRLESFDIRYETYGRLNADASNAILVCHALTGDHHCAGVYSINDRKEGWWNNIIGPNKPLDTNKYFIVCSNCIGGCMGSTGPSSLNPATGRPYNLSFPALTVKDMVAAQARLLDHLGIKTLALAIGGSMGGMQVLQWAVDYPERVRKAIALATTSRENAQSIAFNCVGRTSIMRDPLWNNGNYSADTPPRFGLGIARMMAHITYLSEKGMEEKFGRQLRQGSDSKFAFDSGFEVENYLRYQGSSFVNRFDANSYLYITRALDLYDLRAPDGTLETSLKKVKARVMAVGFTSDWLYPPEQNLEIVQALLRCGKDATYAEIESDLGHDSFLIESPKLYELIEYFLEA